ncbi:NADP-dependent alcohol dehydrogenase [Desulfobotulus alkaliphilus]|uniref:NADP-dependent alcohol dehydrogenase n=1 Tax=Desulfobotulus alkaliphilus TaxID=622671 RepID=A0A562R5X1_9BACT|nr:iron-containing alcohol dehydrogenase [Desulfobotulus alkaliphilus]TWI63964.1 NADP-dependent alcohol dehydrogenase [Desulfobotulus alkaliphilus]
MKNFEYYNPVRIVFGKGKIAELDRLIPENALVLVLTGGGSVKKNGVFDQVAMALKSRKWEEFSGIEANPDYDTCMKAVERIKQKKIDFVLAVGGGSVIDGAKFIVAAACYEGSDPWDIVTGKAKIKTALPFGSVLTLAATGSEMNAGSVISRRSMGAKLPFASEKVFPRFSILDPETTYSLPSHVSACGVVDALVHVLEQYLSHAIHAPLQDRQAEALLMTLMEEGPKVLEYPEDYNVRADIMWCATQALNGVIGCGVFQDWATHMIGHELTAAFGLAHGESLALVLPALLRVRKEHKRAKLEQYGRRVLGLEDSGDMAEAAIAATEAFFKKMGLGVRLSDYGIPNEAVFVVADILDRRGFRLGEDRAVDGPMVREILAKASAP